MYLSLILCRGRSTITCNQYNISKQKVLLHLSNNNLLKTKLFYISIDIINVELYSCYGKVCELLTYIIAAVHIYKLF